MKFDFFPRTFDTGVGGSNNTGVGGSNNTPPPAGGTPPGGNGTGGGGGAPSAPWYQGKADDRIIGAWQNNFPQHVNDPALLAVAATTSWLEAQKALGVPADQILRVPTKADDPAWSNVWKRLGRPDQPTEYVLKNAKGEDLAAPVADWLRSTAHKANLSKDAAATIAAEFAKFNETQVTNAQAEYDAKLAEGKSELAKNWGSNHAANLEVAKAGARALGVDAQVVASLEQTIGYAKVMEMFRVVGSKTSEGKFVASPNGAGNNGNGPMTLQQAIAKKEELFADKLWVDKFSKGDRAAARELEAIEHIMAAAMGNAA